MIHAFAIPQLGATIPDALKISAKKLEISQLAAQWKPELAYYEPEEFRNLLMAVIDSATAIRKFYRQFQYTYMDPTTRSQLKEEFEKVYGAGGILDTIEQSYLEPMKLGLAKGEQVHAPDFRRDVFDALDRILQIYQVMVEIEAASNWFFGSDAAQDFFGALETICDASRAVINGAGSAVANAGKAVVEATSKAGLSLMSWVLIGVGGIAAIGIAYWAVTSRKRKR